MLNTFVACFLAAMILLSCGGSNNVVDYIDSSLHMRPPVPVIVETPLPVDELEFPPGTTIIVVGDQTWLFVRDGDTTACTTSEEFIAAIKNHGASRLNGKLVLQADSKATVRIDETIALLKQDSIVRFNLVTDLQDSLR